MLLLVWLWLQCVPARRLAAAATFLVPAAHSSAAAALAAVAWVPVHPAAAGAAAQTLGLLGSAAWLLWQLQQDQEAGAAAFAWSTAADRGRRPATAAAAA
jgi:hypothetical protein